MRVDPRTSFFWHAFFLAVTTSFTEVNTVMPALVLAAGGGAATVGALTAIMLGLPLVAQLLFAGFLSTRPRKKPFLLLGINLRVLALAGGAAAIAGFGTDTRIIPAVFAAITVFALSGAFAGVSYTELIGTLVPTAQRREFFVRRQMTTTAGLFVSAVVARFLLGAAAFPDGYVLLFALASGFLLVASGGFWSLHEPRPRISPGSGTAPPPTGLAGTVAALRQAPTILREDGNLRTLIVVVNLLAVGFTSIPLVTALAHRRYELSAATVGTFVLVQITGMLLASPAWSRVIRRGGYRLVLRIVLGLVTLVFPLALLVSATAPVLGYAALYLITGAIVSGQKIAVDGTVVQISPDGRRALYAGLFGAANLATALLPLITGVLVERLGYPAVFAGAGVAALLAFLPVRHLDCGDWYRTG
ncbi:MAG: MFS transporter [Kineosporiaceae bacterium]